MKRLLDDLICGMLLGLSLARASLGAGRADAD